MTTPQALAEHSTSTYWSHINNLAHGDLNPSEFGRKVLWNPHEERIEMYLESRASQSARIAERSIYFAAGETIQIGGQLQIRKRAIPINRRNRRLEFRRLLARFGEAFCNSPTSGKLAQGRRRPESVAQHQISQH